MKKYLKAIIEFILKLIHIRRKKLKKLDNDSDDEMSSEDSLRGRRHSL